MTARAMRNGFVKALERIARLSDRLFDRLRDPRAFTLTDDDATDESFESLRARRYAVLVTFRRNGDPVPSPVWIGVRNGDDVAYVKTAPYAGKVKRLGNDNRVLLAPSNVRGRPAGPAVRGTARLLPTHEWPRAEQTLAAAQGLLRSAFERLLGGQEELSAYLEITRR